MRAVASTVPKITRLVTAARASAVPSELRCSVMTFSAFISSAPGNAWEMGEMGMVSTKNRRALRRTLTVKENRDLMFTSLILLGSFVMRKNWRRFDESNASLVNLRVFRLRTRNAQQTG